MASRMAKTNPEETFRRPILYLYYLLGLFLQNGLVVCNATPEHVRVYLWYLCVYSLNKYSEYSE
jgi:hypothetical protein